MSGPADPSAGEARLTDKILKGFFFVFKTSLLYPKVLFLSLSLFFSQSHIAVMSGIPSDLSSLLSRRRKNKRPENARLMFDLSRRNMFSPVV
jgi:hypothetical protein